MSDPGAENVVSAQLFCLLACVSVLNLDFTPMDIF